MPLLGLIVVRIDLQPEPNLFQDGVGLLPTGVAGLHSRLVLVLAVIHEAAHRRLGVGGNLDEVEAGFLGKSKCVFDTHHTHLFPAWSYQSDFGNTDAVVDAGLANGLLLRRSRSGGKRKGLRPPVRTKALKVYRGRNRADGKPAEDRNPASVANRGIGRLRRGGRNSACTPSLESSGQSVWNTTTHA